LSEPKTQLLASIANLLTTQALPDEPTIDFALQSLKTVWLANADNAAAQRQLEDLTRRLADEAKLSFDRGNTPLARRLIEQARASGVLFEYVSGAADHIVNPRVSPTFAPKATPRPMPVAILPALTPALRRAAEAEAPGPATVVAEVVEEVNPTVDQQALEVALPTVQSSDPVATTTTVATVRQPPAELQRYLDDARSLYEAGYIITPPQRSSVSVLRLVLEQDDGNPAALLLLERCADHLISAAKEAEQVGLAYEARNLIEEVLAFHPHHAEANALWARWTQQDA
jgi:hypothetical protein